ncbi:hypothetical protein Bpfe_010133 [Biomphalaria pfeifferi]|uniref:Secreted protein n=1 Tax=Biomphalaria pfeifferi TaxID=112525 RepID=A0AAD8BT28_BIOPF|nr:hypothetical protein Bpfe_010133 [Biomphalaria pfeifferi]
MWTLQTVALIIVLLFTMASSTPEVEPLMYKKLLQLNVASTRTALRLDLYAIIQFVSVPVDIFKTMVRVSQ